VVVVALAVRQSVRYSEHAHGSVQSHPYSFPLSFTILDHLVLCGDSVISRHMPFSISQKPKEVSLSCHKSRDRTCSYCRDNDDSTGTKKECMHTRAEHRTYTGMPNKLHAFVFTRVHGKDIEATTHTSVTRRQYMRSCEPGANQTSQ
jgi:hypothetical protein